MAHAAAGSGGTGQIIATVLSVTEHLDLMPRAERCHEVRIARGQSAVTGGTTRPGMTAVSDGFEALEALEVLRQFVDFQIGTSKSLDASTQTKSYRALSQEHLSFRALRYEVLGPDLASETSWDILLLVYLAKCCNRKVCLNELKYETNIPVTTIIRWVGVLEAAGLILRKPDPTDARRLWLFLGERGVALVEEVLARQVKGDHLKFFSPFSKGRRRS